MRWKIAIVTLVIASLACMQQVATATPAVNVTPTVTMPEFDQKNGHSSNFHVFCDTRDGYCPASRCERSADAGRRGDRIVDGWSECRRFRVLQ
jgi:hypothetical protein